MVYYSDRRMSELAVGLIGGCFDFFEEEGEVKITNSTNDDTEVNFLIRIRE